jgi:DNA polymerase I-like protein with 3'-5' exonuclease and polymerase domains
MITGIDTETTGADPWHGCRPFFVSTFDDVEGPNAWEWDVDPMTREVLAPKREILQVRRFIESRTSSKKDRLVFHNTKFDVRMLNKAGIKFTRWENVEDTVIASHTMASGESHKLKDLAAYYLDIDDEDQKELQDAVNAARRIGRKLGWRIADKRDPHFPAMNSPPKGVGWWALDMWLPRAVAKHEKYPKSHDWWTVLRRYAIRDAERTFGLWMMYKDALKQEGLYEQYKVRRKLLRVCYKMESRGVTGDTDRLESEKKRFTAKAFAYQESCLATADYKIDNLESPKQLQGVLFGRLKVKPLKKTKTGYSTAKEVLAEIKEKLPLTHPGRVFIHSLQKYRKNDKAVENLDGYDYSRVSLNAKELLRQHRHNYFRLHPSFNITGTDTTRLSCSNPTVQNVSKQEGFNLRYVFGPIPGRIWYAIDYSNIEMRLFAYCAGDQKLIDAFESGQSVHLIFCQILYPKEYAWCERRGIAFNDKYEATLYQWVKNGNFSLIYGAGAEKADATYHLKGAYDKIRKGLPLIDKFMRSQLNYAKKYGYVECLGGYRLQVPTDEPHKAVNYFVQGSAGWAMELAMLRCDRYLQALQDYYMIMTIHDELDFDIPIAKRNGRIITDLAGLMEQSGDDLGVPLKVDVKVIRDNWAQKEKFEIASAA